MGWARTQVAGEVHPQVRAVPPAATGDALLQKLRGQESRDVFSGIYAHLLASANGAQPRTILVCSASVGEGGTFVAAGFALAVAEEYARQVLLIVANLSVLGVGGMCPDRIRALKPPKFHDLLDELAATYKFILIDGPSIQAHPESLLYAPQVDRVFVVTQAGKTRVPVLARALTKLSTAGCDQVEFILNRRAFVIPHSIYKKL